MTRSDYKDRWSIARILAMIGAIVALIGFAYDMVVFIINSQSLSSLINILWYFLGILISIFILIQVGIIKSKKVNIPFNWWLLFIFVCLQAVTIALNPFVLLSITSIGLLLEVIAVILLLINAL